MQGVIEYSLALFFNKLVSYTFLFWLPYYVKTSCKLLLSPTYTREIKVAPCMLGFSLSVIGLGSGHASITSCRHVGGYYGSGLFSVIYQMKI